IVPHPRAVQIRLDEPGIRISQSSEELISVNISSGISSQRSAYTEIVFLGSSVAHEQSGRGFEVDGCGSSSAILT
ncbi:hypothetical protein A2U01_0096844, partial [Trifolium medium]|nr:hypothetical protein [Trifolium medium]